MNDSTEKGLSLTKALTARALKHFFTLLAIVSLVAVGLMIWPNQVLEAEFSWLIFYPAVIVAAFYGGFYAGLITTVFACLAIIFLWPLVVEQAYIIDSFELVKIAIFVITCSFISYSIEAMQRVKKALKQAESVSQTTSQTEQFIKSIINNTPNMIGYWDRDLRCRYANNAYSEWFGIAAEDIVGMTFQQLAGEQLFNRNKPHIEKVLTGEPQRFERSLRKVDGSVGHIIGHYIPDFASDGTVQGFVIQSNEVTLLKATEAKLKLAACVFDSMLDGVLITDANNIIISVNPGFTEITGYTVQDAIGQTPKLLQSNRQSQAFYAAMWHEITTQGRWQGEMWNHRKDGELYLQRMTINLLRDGDGEPVRYVSVFSDITELRRKDEHIKHLAFHDALTDLPNRTLLMDRINQKLLNSHREQCKLALMFLDLDGFKPVNDKFGHNVGDILLKEMAKRLQALVRQSDTVARVGGDEFIFILNNPQGTSDVTEVANRIISSINQPITILGNEFQIGVSIGIAMYPEHGDSSLELIRNADTAMYIAKSSGKNKVSFFSLNN
ncbi:sensor domain-containing diguanylate cyclase [Rheinheimera salexigens]|nr:sensor domain-containing diguanylate cyclase [Rheinheimera salexigens]